jgi:hypothetical protein
MTTKKAKPISPIGADAKPKARQRKTKPIAPQGAVPAPKLVRLHDLSRECGRLVSVERLEEDDCQIVTLAQANERHVVLPLSVDLSEFIGQPIILMMNREQCLVRLQGHDIHGVPA